MDLLAPVGHGQRGLIVAPPKTGKTTLLEHISQGVAENHPGVRQVVLLIDERPEEVTDFRTSIRAEVVASTLEEVEAMEKLVDRIARFDSTDQFLERIRTA